MKLKGSPPWARRVKRLFALFCRHCVEPSISAKALVKKPIFQHIQTIRVYSTRLIVSSLPDDQRSFSISEPAINLRRDAPPLIKISASTLPQNFAKVCNFAHFPDL